MSVVEVRRRGNPMPDCSRLSRTLTNIGCLAIASLSMGISAAAPRVFGQQTSAQASPSQKNGWPHERTLEPFILHSTVPIDPLESQLERLRSLRSELSKTLALSLSDDPIHIAIFRDRAEMNAYIKRHFPAAPERRAMFIRERGNGVVLTYSHEQWHVDARHECVHALLHAASQSNGSSTEIPIWLDEGLAEYFEIDGNDIDKHPVHGPAVRSRLRYGQVCEIDVLESIGTTSELSPTDYRDAWSAVNLLLNHSAASRLALQTYLQDILAGRASGLISHRIRKAIPDWRDQYTSFYRHETPVSTSGSTLHP